MISILLGTFNRSAHLVRCIEACRRSAPAHEIEFVVCHGGSTDGSRAWLAVQPDVVLIGERRLEGAVKAINQCYALCRGEYIAILNDDIAPVGLALQHAVARLDQHRVAGAQIGQVACPFKVHNEDRPHHIEFVNGLPYANIAVMRRPLLDQIVRICGGVWSPCYRTYGGDTELSCWVHRLGYAVVEEPEARFIDYMPQDALRQENHGDGRAVADNRLFWARWSQPSMLQPLGPVPNVTEIERVRLSAFEHARTPET